MAPKGRTDGAGTEEEIPSWTAGAHVYPAGPCWLFAACLGPLLPPAAAELYTSAELASSNRLWVPCAGPWLHIPPPPPAAAAAAGGGSGSGPPKGRDLNPAAPVDPVSPEFSDPPWSLDLLLLPARRSALRCFSRLSLSEVFRLRELGRSASTPP